MLLFQKRFLAGLVEGSIGLTFRQWPSARVKVGGRYRVHPIGVVEVDKVDRIRVEEITEREAKRAGFESLGELMAYLKPAAKGKFGPRTELFRIALHHAGDGDYVAISRDDQLSDEDVAEIDRKLLKLDGKRPWTRETLRLIEKHPRVAASQLAANVSRETAPFKADVVKLKKLGLTHSFEVGYELSPRGQMYWSRVKRRRK